MFLAFPRWHGRAGRLLPLVMFFRAAFCCPMRWGLMSLLILARDCPERISTH